MNMDKKSRIDKIWRDTDFGKWCSLLANGKTEEADSVAYSIVESTGVPEYMAALREREKEITEKLLSELETAEDYKQYMEALDIEKPELVEIMIAYDIFAELQDALEE